MEPKFQPDIKVRNQVIHNFTYHAPSMEEANRIEYLRERFKNLAHQLTQHCVASRELSLALTHLEQCNMWANAAIVRNKIEPSELAEVDHHFEKDYDRS